MYYIIKCVFKRSFIVKYLHGSPEKDLMDEIFSEKSAGMLLKTS